MPLMVSVDGGPPKPVGHVVLFDNTIPIAVCLDQGSAIFFADSLRDRDELVQVLSTLGVSIPALHANGGILRGR